MTETIRMSLEQGRDCAAIVTQIGEVLEADGSIHQIYLGPEGCKQIRDLMKDIRKFMAKESK